jgi:tetratricopeptide (TPR) repeat protein
MRSLRIMSYFHLAAVSTLFLGVVTPTFAGDIVFTDKAGRTLTQRDLQTATGEFSWEIRSEKPVPQQARAAHDEGRAAGQKGDYAAAIKHFEHAARLAPDWPYPIYDAAFTYLLQGNSDKALTSYEHVDALAPRGFFTAKTAIHYLRKEKRQEIPAGTYLAYLSLEWTDDPVKKASAVEMLLQKAPQFAPAWKAKAAMVDDDTPRLALLEKGLAADPDAETYGFLRVDQALALSRRGERARAIAILGTLALDPASPVDVEALAKQTLATNF